MEREARLLTTEEVSAWLRIKKCTLEKARSTGIGDYPPYVRIGRAIRYRQEIVQAWLEQQTYNNDRSSTFRNGSSERSTNA